MKIKGKNVIITGGASGVGKELTKQMLKSGCNVASIDINEENLKKLKEEYYLAIANCGHDGNSTEFMLKMIDETLDDLMDITSVQASHVSSYVNKLLDVMEVGVVMTTSELIEKLNMKSRISFRDNYLNPALENGLIKNDKSG